MGWTNLVVEADSPLRALALAGSVPRGDTSERGVMQVGADGRSLILTTLDGGRQSATAEEFASSSRPRRSWPAGWRAADLRAPRQGRRHGKDEIRQVRRMTAAARVATVA